MNKILNYIKSNIPKTENNWAYYKRWVVKRLRAHNILVDLNICAYGKTHLVSKVKPLGKAYVVWSTACSGCALGTVIQKSYTKYKVKPETPHCVFLKSALITDKPAEVGSLVQIR